MKLRKSSPSRDQGDPKLSMRSMIDVVFLLLVFFAVAFEPDDVLAKLKVDRPGKAPLFLLCKARRLAQLFTKRMPAAQQRCPASAKYTDTDRQRVYSNSTSSR